MIKKIAITGPESTGKTTLAQALAQHYQTVWVPEYAREYLENLPRKYNYDDILIIAQRQLQKEQELLLKANRYLFVDTELLVTKIWCEHVFGKCHQWIIDHLHKQKYDLYLLCNIDLPWTFDPLREHPHLREYLFKWYLREIKSFQWNFAIINGFDIQERTAQAIKHIESLT
ncbi:MAG: ATP-binding protein [Cytophagales bacterium]|nr:ATP-binding protein [Cytophagales bacterium]MDW8384067.1 ATP-binding protein [Flammeovirgaceae bacterium]